MAAIRAIESDGSLTEQEKAKRRQELMSGGGRRGDDEKEKVEKANGVLDLFDEGLNCSFCMQLPERPVTVTSLSLSLSIFSVCNRNGVPVRFVLLGFGLIGTVWLSSFVRVQFARVFTFLWVCLW